mgnify:CR=1 FL=1
MEYGAIANLIISVVPIFWYLRKYPQDRKHAIKVLVLVLIWSAMLFNVGLDGMEILGLEEGLPQDFEK